MKIDRKVADAAEDRRGDSLKRKSLNRQDNLGFGIWDLGFGIWDLGFGIWDLGFGICTSAPPRFDSSYHTTSGSDLRHLSG
jgi:hypothetical protein